MTHHCRHCGQDVPDAEWVSAQYVCRSCYRAYMRDKQREWRAANPGYNNRYVREAYARKHQERANETE